LRAIYDMAFCFAEGNANKASVAAGTALRNMILLGTTKNRALFMKMNAGMGDAIFGPYYEVLRNRGVKFEFFTWVDQLHVDQQGRIGSIDIIKQVDLTGHEYQPLVTIKDLPCWPSEPLWDQLVGCDGLRKRGSNLEFEKNPLDKPMQQLKLGTDFAHVVLAIPVGALPPICTELAATNPKFAAMLAGARTTITQAFQLWTTVDAESLGWTAGDKSLCGSYVEPLDTYSDMSLILDREDWPAKQSPNGVGYFCGVLPDPEAGHETLDQATARARLSALQFINNDLQVLWPKAFDANHNFRWELLHDPNDGVGVQRFDSQYWRANADASERYVLSPPSPTMTRLASNDSGFSNLTLAGDWTRNGLDAGCVEAATISGLQAAKAISGYPFTIAGEDDDWLTKPLSAERE